MVEIFLNQRDGVDGIIARANALAIIIYHQTAKAPIMEFQGKSDRSDQ